MIPNKIYFPADGLPAYIDWDGSPIRTKQVEDTDVCYIRKDAVLELLDKLYDDAPSYDDSRVYLGRAFEQINSL